MSTNLKIPGLRVKNSGPGDIEAVRRICGDVEGSHDYVPQAWVEWWPIQPGNQLYLFELDSQPAALYCLRLGLAAPDAGWMQGVRVATAFRRRGLAAAIIEHAIESSRARQMTVLRYATNSKNTPMHRLAERYGFKLAGKYLMYRYPADRLPAAPAAPPLRPLTLAELDRAYRVVSGSETYRAHHSFYCSQWNWRPLTREHLQEHITRGEVLALPGPLSAVALLVPDEDSGSHTTFYQVGLLAGEPAAERALLAALVYHTARAARPGAPTGLEASLGYTPYTLQLLLEAGFQPDPHEPEMLLYELKLF